VVQLPCTLTTSATTKTTVNEHLLTVLTPDGCMDTWLTRYALICHKSRNAAALGQAMHLALITGWVSVAVIH
jgi:hypothetical protein